VDLDRIVDLDLGINLVLDPVVTIPPGDSVTFSNDAGPTQGLLQKEGACPTAENRFENTATVYGSGAGSGDLVEATDPACVKCGPCIEILKDVRDFEAGGAFQPADTCDDSVPINNGAEYRLAVTNCGAEVLRDVVINDAQLGIVDFPVGTVDIGETKFFFFDQPDGGISLLLQKDLCLSVTDPDGQFENTAAVSGTGVDSGIIVDAENPACIECQPECDIQVVKTCEIIPSPADPLLEKCDGKIQQFTLIWGGAAPITISGLANDDADGVIEPGQEVTFTPPADTDVFVDISSATLSGQSKFHLSCSDDDMNADNDNDAQEQLPGLSQDCGKFQGNAKDNDDASLINDWLLEGIVDADGLVLDCTPPEPFPTETEECEFTPQPDGGNCDDIKDITGLTLVWNGPNGVNIVSEVGQVIDNIQNGDIIFLDTPKDDTGNDVEVFLSGAVSGISQFHISCSDDDMDGPEDCGTAQGNGKGNESEIDGMPTVNDWVFGGMTGEKGSFGCPGFPGGADSAEVVYGIRVENPNDEPVDVRIVDVKLGIDQTATIPANDFLQVVTDPQLITPDATNEFTNTVIVTAESLSGAICEASDSVTVKRNPPPPPPVSCSDIKNILAVSLIWDGPGPINVVTEGGQMFEDVQTGNQITFDTPEKDTELFISGAVNGTSKVHVSCSDDDMNGSEDCGKAAGDAKGEDGLVNLWLFDGMIGEQGSFACNLPNSGVVDPSDGGPGGGMVTGAPSLDLGDDKKVKWELTNNGAQDVFVEKVIVTWPDAAEEHDQLKKFKLEGDFAKDVYDDISPTTVPDEKAFESDPNKRKLKAGDDKKLEIEFTKEFDDKSLRSQDDFTIQVEFDTGQVLNFP
jgi:hypothetical protein